MMVWSLFIIGLMGLFFYNKIGSIIPTVVLPTTEIIEPKKPGFHPVFLDSLHKYTRDFTYFRKRLLFKWP
mgnify:CR=1 FL=1